MKKGKTIRKGGLFVRDGIRWFFHRMRLAKGRGFVENFLENVEKMMISGRSFVGFGWSLFAFVGKYGNSGVSNNISHSGWGNIGGLEGVFKRLFHSLCKTFLVFLRNGGF